MNNSLFTDFPAVTYAEWKAQAIRELKDKPYDSIVWQTPDGFALEAWYSRENKSEHLAIPVTKATNSWKMCHTVQVNELAAANETARRCCRQGATALEFVVADETLCSTENLKRLLADIDGSATALHFSGKLPPLPEFLTTLATLPNFSNNSGSVTTALPDVVTCDAEALFAASAMVPNFRFLAVDVVPFHQQGATASQELAFALAQTSDLLHHFIEKGIAVDRIAEVMEIILPVSSSHFVEITKPRALRYLLQHLLQAYGGSGTTLPRLFARSSQRNLSALDPYTNVLRLTTEAISAILGGYETLQLRAFDNGISVDMELAERITGNIQLILKEESALDRVVDPARGSTYIETMTRQLAEAAWTLFKEIEATGGFAQAEKAGLVQTMIASATAERTKSLAQRRKTLIGVNRYTVPLTAEQLNRLDELAQQIDTSGTLKMAVSPLLQERKFNTIKEMDSRLRGNDRFLEMPVKTTSETAGYELLRLTMQRHSALNGTTPSLFIWQYGDPLISMRQAAFCEEFFAVGGFALAGNATLPLEAASYQTALSNQPAIVVLCIAEKEPLATAETICRELHAVAPNVLLVMAGKPPKEHQAVLNAGLDSFIYTGCNVLEMLSTYQRKTGVA